MKKIFLLITAIFSIMRGYAYDFEVDGIYYNFIFDRFHCVSVTHSYDNPYNGEVNIPETVFYYGINYNVVSVETLYGGNGNENITKVTMPSTIDTIDDFFFCYYDRNTELCGDCFYIEDGLIYDRDKTILYFCQDMIMSEQYTAPVVTTIGSYAFKGQNHIKEIVVPEGVEYIRGRGLGDMSNLCKVSLPASLKLQENYTQVSISWVTFEGSGNLEEINVSDGNPYLSSNEGVLYDKDKTEIILYPNSSKISHYKFPATLKENYTHDVRSESLTSFEIPQKVHEESMMYRIHGNFQDAIIPYGTKIVDLKSALLKSIKIPYNSLYSADVFSQSMESFCPPISSNSYVYGVQQCHYKSFVIPQGTLDYPFTFIHNSAFYNWSELESLVLPPTINTIYAGAFSGCDKLSCIELPSSLTHVENFLSHSNLSEIICKAIVPPNGDEYINDYLSKYSNDIVLKVPSGSVEAYKSTAPWSNINNIVGIDVEDNIEIEFAEYYIKYAKHLLKYTTEGTDYLDFPSSAKATLQSVINAVEPKIHNRMTLQEATSEKERVLAAIYAYYNKQVGYNGGNVDPGENPSNPSDVKPSTDVSAYPNVLYFNDVESRTGDFNLELNMKCAEENITAFQCDVYLPEGVEWKSTTDKRGNIVYNLPTFNEDRTDNSYHTINPIAKNSDGSYKIIVYSMQKDNILETDGALLYLPLQISEEMESGEYNISVKNIVLTDVHTQQTLVDEVVSKLTIPSYVIGDANGDDMINVTDIVSIISYILGEADSNFTLAAADINGDGTINVTDIVGVIDIILNANPDMTPAMMSRAIAKAAPKVSGNDLQVVPFTVSEGTTSTTAKLNMNNPGDEFTAFQCEVEFPEGISWASTVDKRGNVKYTAPTFDAEADRTDASYHTVEIGKNASGNINIFVYSMQKEVILDEEGAVLDLPFVVDDNLTPGIYDVKIKNIVMTRTDQSDVKPADYTFSILVGSPAESTIALKGNFTDEAINEYNTALATNTTVAAIDLSDAADVSSNTAFATGNQNLVLYVAEDAVVKNTNNVVIGDECASLILTDGYSFAAPKAFTANNASYSRTMGTTWGTICLPYAVASDESTAYYEITGVENDVITLTKYDELPAGTPALVKKLSGTEITPQATSVAVSGDINDVTGTVKMYGSYTNKVRVEDPNSYYIYNNKFYSCNEYFFCNAFRAYFTLESAGAKMLRIADDDDVVTAIDALTGEGNGIGVESIYGEDGILRKDMEKGMNIVKFSNGKTQKIIIK